jgi:predicted ATPase
MLTSIQVSNFRSLRDVKVHKLKRLNLVTGSNGGGKTSFLEAIFLNAGAANAGLAFSINSFRGDNIITPAFDRVFRSWFWELDPKHSIRISAEALVQVRSRGRTLLIDALLQSQATPGRSDNETMITGVRFNFTGPAGKATGSARITPPAPGPLLFPGQPQVAQPPISVEADQIQKDAIYAQFISPYIRDIYQEVSSQLIEVIKNKEVETLVETLSIIEPEVRNIVPITEWGQANIYIDIGLQRLLPLFVLGSGFLHLLRIALALSAIKDGIIIIDELEDGLHYSVLPRIVTTIIQAIENSKVQFFISTHSADLIKVFIEAAKERHFDNMCLVNLVGGDGPVETRYFDRSELDFAAEYGAELR